MRPYLIHSDECPVPSHLGRHAVGHRKSARVKEGCESVRIAYGGRRQPGLRQLLAEGAELESVLRTGRQRLQLSQPEE